MDGFTLYQQGAEGRLHKGTYLGKPAIIKERFVKKYRHLTLDEHLTKERIKSESRALLRCKAVGIKTPTIYLVDFKRRMIFMEYYEHSITAKDYISSSVNEEDIITLSKQIGDVLAKMHKSNIIHGDLTTSNILLVNKNNISCFNKLSDLELVLIDFGLAHVESGAEDKGVDLYVLERALNSTHKEADKMFPVILEAYKQQYKKGNQEVLAKYEDVRTRGRKRTMVG